MFFRKKKDPWWKKWIANIQYAFGTGAAIAASVAGLFAYIQLDTTEFADSTQLSVIHVAGTVYVEWDVIAPIDEEITLTYYVNNEQVGHYHYHYVHKSKWIHEITLPLGVEEPFDFTAQWEIKGLTTAFQVERIIFDTEVGV